MTFNMPLTIMYAIEIILNDILRNHLFPTNWRMMVVLEFLKNRRKQMDTTKYRPISLIHLLAKLLDFIPDDQQTVYQKALYKLPI